MPQTLDALPAAAIYGAAAALLLGGVISAAQWLLAKVYGESLRKTAL